MNDKERIIKIVEAIGELIPYYSVVRSIILGHITYKMSESEATMFLDRLYTVLDRVKD